jgi:hypothetical protein
MFKQLKLVIGAALTATLVACGGGGDSGTQTTAAAIKADGLWSGLTSTGLVINTLILDNNEFWALFGTSQSGFFYVQGFDQGNGTLNGSSFSGAGREYYPNRSSLTGTFSVTVNPGVSLNGTATSTLGTNSFTMSPINSSFYVYDKPAALADVVGSWSGNFLDGTTGALTISSTGAVSGTNNGCSYTGTATPRASGKNVFDVSITFGAGNCVLPGQKATGIGINYLLSSGKREIIVGVLDSSKVLSALFFAQR